MLRSWLGLSQGVSRRAKMMRLAEVLQLKCAQVYIPITLDDVIYVSFIVTNTTA